MINTSGPRATFPNKVNQVADSSIDQEIVIDADGPSEIFESAAELKESSG